MKERTLEADVCIVGSGVAGMTLASRIAPRFERIVVLERGRRVTFAESLQRMQRGQFPFPTTALSRNYFRNVGRHEESYNSENHVGGSTLRWWGHALRLAPHDFALKSTYGVGVDWPLGYDDLEPHLCEAERELSIAGSAEDSPWPRSQPYPQPAHPFSPHEEILVRELGEMGIACQHIPLGRLSRAHAGRPACCGSGVCSRLCPTEAKYTALNTHVPRAEGTGRVTLHPGIKANLLSAEGTRIRALAANDEEGRPVRVVAGLFVLAANALENTRVLLLSQEQENFRSSPALGRYYMNHPNLEVSGRSLRDLRVGFGPTPSNAVSHAFYDGPFRSQRAAGVLELLNRRVGDAAYARAVLRALGAGLRGEELLASARRQVQGRFDLGFQMELLPSPTNRVGLSRRHKDPFGFPVLEIAFDAWPPYVQRAAAQVKPVLERLAVRLGGRIRFRPRFESRHLMGACRMGASLEDSVVDANLRHHAYENLYVTGSGVFPTCGAADPTVTLAALSLRCADHIVAMA